MQEDMPKIRERLPTPWNNVPHVFPTQRSRTTVEGTKPQCQPIDLRCSLRGPLLRREKNKLIERGSEGERENGTEKEDERRTGERRGPAEGRGDGASARRAGESAREEREERARKKRADQRAA